MAANSAYALVQALHNFGAVAVVGSPAAAWFLNRSQRVLPTAFAGLTLVGWIVQTLSGIGFGLTSYLSRGELPEVSGPALIALYLKIGCAFTGFALAAYSTFAPAQLRERTQRWLWPCLFAIGIGALCSAAVLRWFG